MGAAPGYGVRSVGDVVKSWGSRPRLYYAAPVRGLRGSNRSPKDWRKVVGMFGDSEFMREVDEECQRMREAERDAARRGESPE